MWGLIGTNRNQQDLGLSICFDFLFWPPMSISSTMPHAHLIIARREHTVLMPNWNGILQGSMRKRSMTFLTSFVLPDVSSIVHGLLRPMIFMLDSRRIQFSDENRSITLSHSNGWVTHTSECCEEPHEIPDQRLSSSGAFRIRHRQVDTGKTRHQHVLMQRLVLAAGGPRAFAVLLASCS